MAFARLHPDGFSELFTHELASGKEGQVTFDKKHIGDAIWSADDKIVYASERSGNVNLWTTSASAGQSRAPVQVTKGGGPDVAMRLSADGKKLVYLQSQPAGHVFIADSSGA